MGWGDEILASGEARRLYEKTGKRVLITNKHDQGRWSPVWQGNPIIIKPPKRDGSLPDHVKMKNCGGHRFYLDYERMEREFKRYYPNRPFRTSVRDGRLPYRFNDHDSARGELHFVTKAERPKYIIIEPHFKPGQYNRDWGWSKWHKVVNLLRGYPLLQISPMGKPALPGVQHIPANNFIDACRRMGEAIMFVGPEGGLYHAAAALHIPSVAIFGGFVSPANQGYPESINIYDPEGSPCGNRTMCKHCRDIMKNLHPATVANAVKGMFNDRVSYLSLDFPRLCP